MSAHRKALLILLVAGLAGGFLINRYVFAAPMQKEETKRKWEYCRLYGSYMKENHYIASIATSATREGSTDEIETNFTGLAALNKLGADGWELVAVTPATITNGPEYLFKRPRP